MSKVIFVFENFTYRSIDRGYRQGRVDYWGRFGTWSHDGRSASPERCQGLHCLEKGETVKRGKEGALGPFEFEALLALGLRGFEQSRTREMRVHHRRPRGTSTRFDKAITGRSLTTLKSKAGCDALTNAIKAKENKLHVLVNNSGATWGAPFEDVPEKEGWDRVMNLNVKSIFYSAFGIWLPFTAIC